MPRDFSRTRRVGEQIQRDLSSLIREQIKDPRLGMVSISGVEVVRDLSHAKVYISILGDEASAKESMAVLERAAGFLRHRLGQMLLTRTVPQLHFVHDVSIEQGERLDALISQAIAEDESNEN
ncbi:MAG: 30S ribosome-binding factor RbfA [Gammaproteobacteria bacterium]|nr:30S ribosome-binding factor RbfA [Gammaproteobacteria bacterium]